ncbi:tetratricopeptide repeat protein [Pseudoalteromonas sp. OOF1S-7]|uniref:tetratricopeptide repeat protein n=1 Tax=Pseudoalteromonas sp. OOF1S-7 TaxID=2917757 RepID=UPI001EF5145E|nr:tetratricopeptide repeat protein [Pseudoalteromonas sp. OOF1S-7]MCG7534182.1 tetratricopeptide repeat protein [Pseudoalteromonas sp. OOF1S-7]
MLTSLLFSAAVVFTPAELFKTLNQLKELNDKNPAQAALVFHLAQERLPTEPSKGLLQVYLAGLESGVRARDHKAVTEIIEQLNQEKWQAYLQGEHIHVIGSVAVYHRHLHDYEYAEQLNECALNYVADEKQYARIANNLAVVYRFTGQHKKATGILNEAMMLSDDREIIANIKNNLGNLYFDSSSYRNAQLMYIRAFLFHSEAEQFGHAAGTGLNLLNTQIHLRDWGGFMRFKSSVAAQITASEQMVFNDFYQWQLAVFDTVVETRDLQSEVQTKLIASMPALIGSELTPSVDLYVQLLDNTVITAAWSKAKANRPKQALLTQTNSRRIVLKRWCAQEHNQLPQVDLSKTVRHGISQ